MPSEFDLIARYFVRPTPQAVLGPGDDCALLAPAAGMELAVTTDMLVAGTHFFADTDPFQLGWKTVAVNISDLAAMGAKPRWILLAGSLPQADELWIAAFADGLHACAQAYGADLVGGDTTRGPLNFCLTAIGEVPAGTALRRDRAQVGDDIWVSGQPGLAALGLAQLQGRATLPEPLARRCVTALQRPLPRLALGIALRTRALASAAIDVSDGLLADLGHIAERSHVLAEVAAPQLPCLPIGSNPAQARQAQLAGGDDYELIFTAHIDARHRLAELAQELDLPLWRIGRISALATDTSPQTAPVVLLDENEQAFDITEKGFDHFGQNRD